MPCLVVMLDFQNLGVSAADVPKFDDWIMGKVEPAQSASTDELFKAFTRPNQQAAVKELRRLGWKIAASNTDSDQAIIHQAKSNCGHDSANTTFVLVSRDGDFVGLIETLRRRSVSVYVAGPSDTSQRLIRAAGPGRWWQMPATWLGPPQAGTAQVFSGLEWLDRFLPRTNIRP